MPMPRVRFTIRRMMIPVAIVAVSLVMLKGLWSVATVILYTPRGWELSSFLSPGQAVVLLGDYDAPAFEGMVPASRQDFYDFNVGLAPKCHIEKGALAVIAFDQGDNDDTASRRIAIKLVGGQHGGSVVAVPRGLVRKR